MLNMCYIDESTLYEVEFQYINKNRVKLIGDFPVKNKGFILTRINELRAFKGDYTKFNTIYREYNNGVEFSNNGEVYNPYKFVTFSATAGGSLNGNLKQEIKDFSEIVIPVIMADEDYEFEGWSIEIPTTGEILNDITFIAMFKSTKHEITFFANEGGELEGELNQKIENYSDLIIPMIKASANYKFSTWEPEIPTEGEVLENQIFTAIFTSTLPTLEDRINTAEQAIAQNSSDIADTQDALCELSMLTASL